MLQATKFNKVAEEKNSDVNMALSENQKKYIVDLTEVGPVLIAVEGKNEFFHLLVLFGF